MPKYQDTDYLYISVRLHMLEANLLTRERLMRLITAKSGGEAVKVLEESGWSPFDPDDLLALEREIDAQRAQSYALLEKFLPDTAVIDVFRLRFDYHNIKVLVKSAALCLDERALLSPAGTIPLSRLEALFREEAFDSLDEVMAQAVRQSIHELKTTGDPQRSDLILDQAMLAQMFEAAKRIKHPFVEGYVRLFIDCCNLRVAVRAARAGRSFDYLRRAVAPNGNIAGDRLVAEITPALITQLFNSGLMQQAAQAAVQALECGSMAALDLACDNALIEYAKKAKTTPYGVEHILYHLAAREAEYTAVRIIMSGRAAGLTEEKIQERLRMSHV